ncbi:MAG: biotin--[acetyl-CoA-carboxylase] ligase [Ilumatobacteraceae bacterium]
MDPLPATSRHAPVSWPPGWTVRVVERTGSTNADLLRAAAEGAPDRTVLIAGYQDAGRGRLARRWESPPGANLLMSVLFRRVGAAVTVLPHRLALAALTAARVCGGVDAQLKWPNDLVVDDRKVAGLLSEVCPDPDDTTTSAVVVGLGMNVGWAPPGAAMFVDRVDPLRVAAVVLEAFGVLGDDAHVATEYRRHLATLGRRVRVELASSIVEGRAVDLDDDGRLVVLDDCGISHHFAAGDVVHLR